MGLVKEFWDFLKIRKKFWLAPILIVLVMLSGLLFSRPVRPLQRRSSIRSSRADLEHSGRDVRAPVSAMHSFRDFAFQWTAACVSIGRPGEPVLFAAPNLR